MTFDIVDHVDHHVRFASGTHLDPEPINVVEAEDPNLPPEAHVGILKNHHTYGVKIPVPHSLGPVVNACHTQSNIHFTVTEPPETVEVEEGAEDGFKYVSTVMVNVKTIKEGSISERIEVFVDDGKGGRNMEVLLTAKVIKTSQGNPVLREGVHMLSHQHSSDSDFTEWPGFSKEPEEVES